MFVMIRGPPRSTLFPGTTLCRSRRRYIDSFDMSWIYHDSALEGVVYTFEELRLALSGQLPVTDSSLQPTYDDIRRQDRKSTRLNSSHANISYVVFCLKKTISWNG